MSKKTKLKLKTYEIVARAVEEGVAYGYRRAHKHTDEPSEEHFKQELESGVMGALCDVVDFDSA